MDLTDFAPDSTIAELIRSKNYKQVIRNLDKRLKKFPNDLQSIALKANVTLINGDIPGCYAICSRLVDSKPPIVDTALIELIYHNLCELQKLQHNVDEQVFDSLWQNAINSQKNPNDKLRLTKKWASQTIRQRQWQHTVKASMMLQKSFPANPSVSRTYWFWQIVSRYMASQSASSDQLKQIQLGLVLKILEKAVNDTPENADPTKPPGLWISSSQELKLLINVFRRQESPMQILEATDKTLKTAETDYAFAIERSRALTNISAHTARWLEANFALQAAEDHHREWLLDDSRVWSDLSETALILNHSGIEIVVDGSNENAISVTKKLAGNQVKSERPARAAEQAMLELEWHESVNLEAMPDDLEVSPKLRICKDHLGKYIERHSAFDELEDKLDFLDSKEALLLRQSAAELAKSKFPTAESRETSQIKWFVAETNALRVDFHFLKSEIRSKRHISSAKLESVLHQFILNCVRLYKLSAESSISRARTDSLAGDDAGLLATQALDALYIDFGTSTAVLNRACLLWEMTRNSEFNFVARTQLVGSLVQLGLYPTSFEIYEKLDVKDILHESMSPLVFAHVSTAFPFASILFDGRKSLDKALGFYERALARIPNYQETSLESCNYAQVAEMEDLAKKLRESPTRWLLGLERRRISRFRNDPYDDSDLSFDLLKLPLNMSFDHMSQKTAQYTTFQFGGTTGFVLYCKILAYLDLTQDVLFSSSLDGSRSSEIIRVLQDEQLWESVNAVQPINPSQQDPILFCKQLISLVSAVSSGAAECAKLIRDIDELSKTTTRLWDNDRITYWNSSAREELFPFATFCRECYTVFELLQNCIKTSQLIQTAVNQTQKSLSKKDRQTILQQAKNLTSLANERLEKLLETAAEIRSEVPKRLVPRLRSVTEQDDQINNCLKEVVREDTAEKFIINFSRDANSALEGISKLKLHPHAFVKH